MKLSLLLDMMCRCIMCNFYTGKYWQIHLKLKQEDGAEMLLAFSWKFLCKCRWLCLLVVTQYYVLYILWKCQDQNQWFVFLVYVYSRWINPDIAPHKVTENVVIVHSKVLDKTFFGSHCQNKSQYMIRIKIK